MGCEEEAEKEGKAAEEENHYAPGPVLGSQAPQGTEQTDNHASWLWHLFERSQTEIDKQVSR